MDLNRTLVIAPHPDDESIAAGGLLQRAIAAGGEVRVIVVTDGDNNPWPVRYLKKKVRVDGCRPRGMGRAAPRGIAPRAGNARRPRHCLELLGYPDRLLTTMARRGDLRVRDAIAAAIESFAPSLLGHPLGIRSPSRSPRHRLVRARRGEGRRTSSRTSFTDISRTSACPFVSIWMPRRRRGSGRRSNVINRSWC